MMSKKIYCDVCGTLVVEFTKGRVLKNSIAICDKCNSEDSVSDSSDTVDFMGNDPTFNMLKDIMGMGKGK